MGKEEKGEVENPVTKQNKTNKKMPDHMEWDQEKQKVIFSWT